MKEQNFKNHAQLVPGFHYVVLPALMLILIGSVVNLLGATGENCMTASLLTALSIILILIAYYARAFALKAQDRAIRAEENFRYFILTGKPFPSTLKIYQIIALRFASDEEFISLVNKALSENLSNKQIKEAIINWRADNYRA